MSVADPSETGLGADFPGAFGNFLLKILLPSGRREEFVGDLIEEAETVILPRNGRNAALWWFWWQAWTSASPMHVHHCAREVGMHRQRWIVVAAILVFGALMAWDSRAFTAPAGSVALVVTALAIPAIAGLLSGNLRVHAVAALTSTGLLVLARSASGVELRWYAIPWILYVLLNLNRRYEDGISSSGDGAG